MTREPTHRRTITIEGYDEDDVLVLTGTLRDERPWADDQTHTRVLHEMSLTLTIDRSNFTVVDADADMRRFPHEECATIEPAFRQLVGLSITRGYNRALQDRLGRERGCSHLEFLARAMGPAAIQTMASARGRSGSSPVSDDGVSVGGWLTNTCHLWAEGGVGFEKVRGGWRPGATRYPTPSLVELRRREP